MKEPLTSVIIANWNGGEIFRDCLISLSKINYTNWELIIVDNGSSDESENLIKDKKLKIKRYKILKNKTNLGFAKANNQGFKISKGEYILLLNNDTKVNPKFLDILVKRLEDDPTVGIIQPKILIMDESSHLDNVASFLTKTGFLQYVGYTEKDSRIYNKEWMTFSTKGACMLIRRNIIEKVGFFDSDFGSYFEESDFCWRVWMFGFRAIYYPKAFIYHKVGFSSKRQDQTFIFYHSLKNRLASMIKNFEINNLIIIGGLQLLFIISLSFYYLVKLQFDKSWMIWKAIGWNIIHLEPTLSKRKHVQSLRNKTDQEIFPYILKPVDWKKMFSHFAKVEANFK